MFGLMKEMKRNVKELVCVSQQNIYKNNLKR